MGLQDMGGTNLLLLDAQGRTRNDKQATQLRCR